MNFFDERKKDILIVTLMVIIIGLVVCVFVGLNKKECITTNEDVLVKYGRDITQAAKDNKIDPVIGRDEEIRSITRILSRKTKNNPVLIGEPGVGKTAIVEGLALRIVKGDVPSSLKDKIIELNLYNNFAIK